MGYVLDDANDLWADTFQRSGETYTPTKLVLFTGGTQSGCGPASSETGPFYCPADQKVYLDLDFFKELRNRFGAPGRLRPGVRRRARDRATTSSSRPGSRRRSASSSSRTRPPERAVGEDSSSRPTASPASGRSRSTSRATSIPGDIDEGLQAASAVGDDRIQASAGAGVNPETWTHGSAEQRSGWFNKGFTSGDPGACDTFAAG